MIRTQIYLTDRQCSELAALSKTLGKKQSGEGGRILIINYSIQTINN